MGVGRDACDQRRPDALRNAALEGRFENFTVGRNIEWEKVREIYRLGRKHGMKLAAISGVNGPFSDADIRRVRRLALAARAKAAASAAKTMRAKTKPPKKPTAARRPKPAVPRQRLSR
jgi:sugar phosphate isomerase/epimerase